jgi:hypothetical protein
LPQLVRSIHHHQFSRVESGRNCREAGLRGIDRDHAHLHGLVRFDHVHVRARRAALHAGGRNQHRVVLRFDQQLRVDELVGKQRVVLVGKLRLQLHRAGALIDFIVEGQQRAGAELVLEAAVVHIDRKVGVRLDRGRHARQVVFRDTEDHGDRLQLRDHHQSLRVRGVNDVAGVHET